LGLTIVIITHEMDVIREVCDRVAVMDQGKVVELNTVEEIFSRPQEKITQNFVKQTVENMEEDIQDVMKYLSDDPLYELTVYGQGLQSSFINEIASTAHVEITVVQAKFSQTETGLAGKLFVQVKGNGEQVKQVEKEFTRLDIEFQLIERA